MPSGYTSDLYEGKDVSFTEFALQCARGMGAAVLLRDYDLAVVPTPENVAGENYSEKRLQESRDELAGYEKFSEDEWLTATEEHNKKTAEARRQSIEKNERLRAAYEGMLEQVEAWTPPTPDHEGLKTLMQEQLQQSLQFDVHEDHLELPWYRQLSVDEYRKETLARVRRNVDHYSEEAEKERERNEGRVEWVRALYESLGVAVEA